MVGVGQFRRTLYRATIAVADLRSKVTFDTPRRDNGLGEIWKFATLFVQNSCVPLPGMSIDPAAAEKMADPGKVTIRLAGREHNADYQMKPWERASIKAGLVLAK